MNSRAIILNIKKRFLSGLITRSEAIQLLKAKTTLYDKEISHMVKRWESNEDRT